MEPPIARRQPVTISAHGVDRVDDYAWLADPADPGTAAYLAAERAFYDAATARQSALRAELAAELRSRTPVSDRSVSWRAAGHTWYSLARAGEQYFRTFREADPAAGGADELVLDRTALAAGHDHLEIGVFEPSPDGRLLAYSADFSGDEQYELRFRDLRAGTARPDVVPATYETGAWSADSASFLYTVTDALNRPDRVLRHVLGTDPAGDAVVLTEPDQRFELAVAPSRDGAWIVITAGSRDSSEVHLVSAAAPDEAPRRVAARRPGVEYWVEPLPGGWTGSGEDRLLVVTDDGAPEFRLVEAPVPGPGATGDPAAWTPVAAAAPPADPDGKVGPERLEGVDVFAGHVVLSVRRDVEPLLRVVPRRPGEPPRELTSSVPFGQLRLGPAREYDVASVTVVEENLVTPPAWYDVDLGTGARRELKRAVLPNHDPGAYVTTRIEAPIPGRPDGVPVTLAYRAGLFPDGAPGSAPVGAPDGGPGGRSGVPGLLYGYGAYEACEWPSFGLAPASLMDRGVVYAVAHVRGGGERGRGWWQDGRLAAKQHTFDDFVAARDALVAQGWMRAGRVASRGLSAGGLLQGAAFSQAPGRWAAVVAEVPFVDVVTTMSDPGIPLTVNEWDEWGDPIRDPAAFAAMLAYSPYDNPPPPGRRPALLVTGAVHDPRVLVHEPAKWVARLRATDPDGDPSRLLFRVELGAGAHVGPSGRLAVLDYEAEILAWILTALGSGEARRTPSEPPAARSSPGPASPRAPGAGPAPG